MLLVVLAIWFGFKKARATGRHPILWAFICAAAFIGTQLFAGFAVGVALGIGREFLKWPETTSDDYRIVITGIALVASLVVMYFIFRYLDRSAIRVPEKLVEPPPPRFDPGMEE
jgi:hypothetical protein